MTENVKGFFEQYAADEALRERVAAAEAAYPGSLEIREAFVAGVYLPIAGELGLPFTVEELRQYETDLMLERERAREEDGTEPEGDDVYLLLDHGWTNEEARFCDQK